MRMNRRHSGSAHSSSLRKREFPLLRYLDARVRGHDGFRPYPLGGAVCALLTLATALFGCPRHAALIPVPQVSAQAAQTEKERPLVRPRPVAPTPRLAPSKGTCTPPEADNLVTLGACCNGKPCIGQCVTEHGRVACACFDVRAGCDVGQVCCKFRRGCTAPSQCSLP